MTAMTDKERQAKRRKEQAERGLKPLQLGMVPEQYHAQIKELVREIVDGGGLIDDGRIKRGADQSAEIARLRRIVNKALGSRNEARKASRAFRNSELRTAVQLGNLKGYSERFKRLFWRLYWFK